MRAVLQRVHPASVTVDGSVVGRIGAGWLVLLGVARGDADADADRLADKVVGLRAFADEAGKMNRGVVEAGRLGPGRQPVHPPGRLPRRPPPELHRRRRAGRGRAALPPVRRARSPVAGVAVATGVFRADMAVELVNDGPVTLLLDSRKAF